MHIVHWDTLLAVHTCCANQSCDPEGSVCQPVGCTLGHIACCAQFFPQTCIYCTSAYMPLVSFVNTCLEAGIFVVVAVVASIPLLPRIVASGGILFGASFWTRIFGYDRWEAETNHHNMWWHRPTQLSNHPGEKLLPTTGTVVCWGWWFWCSGKGMCSLYSLAYGYCTGHAPMRGKFWFMGAMRA